MIRLLLCFFLLGLALCCTAQEHRIVLVSDTDARSPAEASIAINPTNPNNIIAVSLQMGHEEFPYVSDYAYVSFDGGTSWQTVRLPNPEGRVQGDDVIAFDAQGRAYHTYIAFDGIRVERPEVARNGIFMSTSDDGGLTWSEPVAVVDHLNTVLPFEDKPWLAIDTVPESPHRGTVHIGWSRFDEYGSADPADSTQVFASRSLDRGQTYAMPRRISDTGGNAADDDGTVMGFMPTVGIDGSLHTFWSGPRGLVHDRSMDGGLTFGNDQVVSAQVGGWDLTVPGFGRSNGLPVAGADVTDGPYAGSVYVAWVDARHGDHDVFISYSRDSGSTWSVPVRVNTDPVGNGVDQFFAWLAVDPADGAVNLIYNDRDGMPGLQTGLTLARSVDGGQRFQSFSLAVPPFEPLDGVFFGDYNGLAAFGGRVVGVFPHVIGGEQVLSAAVFAFAPGTLETR